MELISKDDVIKALQKWNCRDYDSLTINPYEVLRDIPTIEERKEGKWVRITQDVGLRPHQYMCTECHRIIEYSSSELPCLLVMKYPYCHCGAKMKGE